MLGMVFTTFVEMVEDKFSPELADSILADANLPHGGAYTAVGYYPFEEIVSLVSLLSEKTSIPIHDLLLVFGKHLFGILAHSHAGAMGRKPDIFALLASLDDDIHREVRKLYPQADLPHFTVQHRDEHSMQLAYHSPRNLHVLAMGLIEGAAEFYQTPVQIEMQWATRSDPSTSEQHSGHQDVIFTVRLA